MTNERERPLTEDDYKALLLLAGESSERRARVIDEPREGVYKILNAVLPDSYIRPHKHKDPHTSNALEALKGVFKVLIFDDEGTVTNINLVYGGRIANIPANTWYSVVALTQCVFEAKRESEKRHDFQSDKVFAPWAPEEGTPKGEVFLKKLKQKISERD